MKAEVLHRERHVLAENAFVEIVIWRVPRPVKGSVHRFKYRMVLVADGQCVLRYDNEAGKGDHRHVGDEDQEKQGARISFATPELLWKVLTAKRWELLKAMAGQGPLTMRAIASRVERDVKAVHGDIKALLNAGVLDLTEQGQVVFPFDAVRVEFTLRAA
jgi:predicted transcriptional regulator